MSQIVDFAMAPGDDITVVMTSYEPSTFGPWTLTIE